MRYSSVRLTHRFTSARSSCGALQFDFDDDMFQSALSDATERKNPLYHMNSIAEFDCDDEQVDEDAAVDMAPYSKMTEPCAAAPATPVSSVAIDPDSGMQLGCNAILDELRALWDG